jgi:hypothetical protein
MTQGLDGLQLSVGIGVQCSNVLQVAGSVVMYIAVVTEGYFITEAIHEV